MKRIAGLASAQARKPFFRNVKSVKETQSKAKKLMREMLVFWKKNEKEERDVRKRAEKEAVDRAKIEEEKREAARQARKLEFLISQTELYSHFVGNKLKSSYIHQSPARATDCFILLLQLRKSKAMVEQELRSRTAPQAIPHLKLRIAMLISQPSKI